MRLAAHVIGMFLLGSSALLAVGVLFHARTAGAASGGEPLPLTVGTSGAIANAAQVDTASDRVLKGIQSDLERFEQELDRNRRPAAMSALDAARRAADVLLYATGEARPVADISRAVVAARERVQNGDVAGARRLAIAARSFLPAISATVRSIPPEIARYRGAMVLTPRGEINGTVVSVAGDSLVVERGGVRDLLGFIDLRRGTTVRIAANQMIFGEPRRAGATMVVAPR